MAKLISNEAIKLLTYRIQQEEQSSRLYKQMSLWLNNKGYVGAGKLWNKYSSEENHHANWAMDYLLSFGIEPQLEDLDKPVFKATTLVDIVKLSYDHEVEISEQCNALAAKANSLGDYMLLSLALKYVAEQVEELDKLQTILDMIDVFGTSKESLFLLDNKLETLV